MTNWHPAQVMALKNSLIGGRYAPLQIRRAHGDRAYIRAQDIYLRRGVELLVSIGARGKIRRVEVLEVRPRSRPDSPGKLEPASSAGVNRQAPAALSSDRENIVRSPQAAATAAQRLHHQPYPVSPPATHVSQRAPSLESAWFAASERVDLGEMESRGAGLTTWQQNLEQIDQGLSHASFERLSLGTDTGERNRSNAPLAPNPAELRALRREINSNSFTWLIVGGLAALAVIVASYYWLF